MHWKQQSFHEDRAQSERSKLRDHALRLTNETEWLRREKNDSAHWSLTFISCLWIEPSSRHVPDSKNNNLASNMIRSTSFESLPRPSEERSTPNDDDDRKRHSKLRNRAWNDSFRQAVDKSYGQNHPTTPGKKFTFVDGVRWRWSTDLESTPGDKSSKSEKQRFRFSNLFITKSVTYIWSIFWSRSPCLFFLFAQIEKKRESRWQQVMIRSRSLSINFCLSSTDSPVNHLFLNIHRRSMTIRWTCIHPRHRRSVHAMNPCRPTTNPPRNPIIGQSKAINLIDSTPIRWPTVNCYPNMNREAWLIILRKEILVNPR